MPIPSHDVVSELVEIRTELRWIKLVGAAIITALAGLWWQMFELNATVATLAAKLP